MHKGEKHYRWKGGKPWERFKDKQYIAWRNSVLKRDNYICQHCKKQCKKYEKGLAAHHIKEYAKYPDLRFEISNGLTLCRQCHMDLHGKHLQAKEKIPCACGCGQMIDCVDPYGRPRKYVNHHAKREKKIKQDAPLIDCSCGCGKKIHAWDKRGKNRFFSIGHRKSKIQDAPLIDCSCGCGKKIHAWDKQGKKRFFSIGHRMRKPKPETISPEVSCSDLVSSTDRKSLPPCANLV